MHSCLFPGLVPSLCLPSLPSLRSLVATMALVSKNTPVYVALCTAGLSLFICLDPAAASGTSTSSASRLLSPYDALYYLGVRAYFAEEWEKAAELLEKSIAARETLLRTRRECHDNCVAAGHDRLAKLDTEVSSIWDLWAMDWVQQRAECIRFCLNQAVSPAAQPPVSTDIQYEFGTRNPYNFLQVTYYKLGKIQKAVSAAHTFFLANPSHLEMRNNIEKYRRMPGVTEEAFQDREREGQKHWELYNSALQFESSSEWSRAVDAWKECVNETLRKTEDCRAQCVVEAQGFPDDGDTASTAGVFEKAAALSLNLLSCQQSCVSFVATRPGRISPLEDFLPMLLEHLNIAQFKAGDLRGAVQTLRSLLLFYPSDSDSLSNLELYSETLGGDTEAQRTEPAQEISSYVKRSLLEKKLLYFGVENLDFNFTDPDLWTPEEVIPESLRESWRAEREKLNERLKEGEREAELDDSGFYAGGPVPLVGVTITMEDAALNGTNRVVLDGVLTQSECETVLQLATAAASSGDGYRGRRSPHTPHEKFEGLTVLRALKLAQDGLVNQSEAKLLHEIGERARTLLHSYFRSPSALYFSFTHLVCRSAITGKQEGRLDLSHPVHVDNCLLEPETRQCWREPPAFTHRDLSALLYLNDDFEGGDLFFTDRDAKTVTATVRPRCGRLVGFSSGPVNPHGVTAVTAGRRCALALWFTKEKLHRDMEREEAEAVWAAGGQSVTKEEKEDSDSPPTPPRSGRSQGSREKSKIRDRVTGGRDEL
ncbi:prolyl 3-hydroxylase 3 isoform X1 [Megalops cyprinoides]|uniref:prolyl 3-hydroxylase 3 isoform X1 n=2 Tax=Megalops cyprinoides TaxID=118141 RepID=UPI00186496AB|nr:prolyl 3-hydroxylase 3 isoform X1 [Megalops cyprinoides]